GYRRDERCRDCHVCPSSRCLRCLPLRNRQTQESRSHLEKRILRRRRSLDRRTVVSFPVTVGRFERIYYDCPIYYLTLVAYDRKHLLANGEVHATLISFAERAPDYGVSVGRYVIMPDHIHLFAAFTPESIALSKWIKSLKNGLSK